VANILGYMDKLDNITVYSKYGLLQDHFCAA